MKTFRLQIIAPNKIFYDGVCTMVEYNTMEGYVGVYADHIPMTQILKPGKLSIYEENNAEPKVGALHYGFVKIMPDVISILAERVEWKDELDLERAKNSLERAEKRLGSGDASIDVDRALKSKEKAEARIKVATNG